MLLYDVAISGWFWPRTLPLISNRISDKEREKTTNVILTEVSNTNKELSNTNNELAETNRLIVDKLTYDVQEIGSEVHNIKESIDNLKKEEV